MSSRRTGRGRCLMPRSPSSARNRTGEGKAARFEILRRFLPGGGAAPPSYADAGGRAGIGRGGAEEASSTGCARAIASCCAGRSPARLARRTRSTKRFVTSAPPPRGWEKVPPRRKDRADNHARRPATRLASGSRSLARTAGAPWPPTGSAFPARWAPAWRRRRTAGTLPRMTFPPIATTAGASAALGQRVGDYELLGEIARGGMGIVYRARQRAPDRIVALKMILPRWLDSPRALERFAAEAEAAASLEHPGHPADPRGGRARRAAVFLDAAGRRRLAWRRACRGGRSTRCARRRSWWRALAQAVHFAHQRGILHRDLKPGNILFDTADRPYVSDFGLARSLDSRERESFPDPFLRRHAPIHGPRAGRGRGTPDHGRGHLRARRDPL